MNTLKPFSELLVQDLAGVPVMVRIDANVSFVDDGYIDELEGLRIDRALPTIQALAKAGAKVLLVGHMGRDGSESTEQVVTYLASEHQIDATYLDTLKDEEKVRAGITSLDPGGVMVLENIRAYSEEAENDPAFAKLLASYADFYVHEAFSVSHREHASVAGVPQHIPGFFGLNYEQEIKELSALREDLASALVIVGGAKFKTKLDLVKLALDKGASVMVGGALAHTFYQARGFNIGRSRFDDVDIADIATNENILTPEFVHVRDSEGTLCERHISEVEMGDTIVDMGEQTIDAFAYFIQDKRPTAILWNGPLGWYEEGFVDGTQVLAEYLGNLETPVIIGGGDTVYVLEKIGCDLEKFSFVSTGGGALLEFLLGSRS